MIYVGYEASNKKIGDKQLTRFKIVKLELSEYSRYFLVTSGQIGIYGVEL